MSERYGVPNLGSLHAIRDLSANWLPAASVQEVTKGTIFARLLYASFALCTRNSLSLLGVCHPERSQETIAVSLENQAIGLFSTPPTGPLVCTFEDADNRFLQAVIWIMKTNRRLFRPRKRHMPWAGDLMPLNC